MNKYSIINDNIIKVSNVKVKDIPRLTGIKLTLNCANKGKELITVLNMIRNQLGQRAKIIKTKNNVAAFKLRKNMEIGAKLTIRNKNLNNLENILLLALPNILTNTKNPLKFGLKDINLGLNNIKLYGMTGANIEYLIKGKNLNNVLISFLISSKGYVYKQFNL